MGFLTLRSFLYSLALHAVVISALVVNFDAEHKPVFKPKPSENIVEAVTVDEQAVERELQRLQELEQQEQRAMEEKLKKLEEQASAVEQRRKEEEKKQQAAERKRKEEEKRKQEAEKKRKEEERKRAVERKRIEEEQRAAKAELERIEAEKRKAEEQTRLAEEQQKRIEEEKRKAEAERQRREEAKRKKEAEEARQKQLAREQQAQDKITLQNIVADIYHAVVGNFNKTGLPKGLECVLSVQTIPGGEVISVTINKPSGNEVFDRRAVTAVEKASPLPLPTDPVVFERLRLRKFNFIFKPED